MEQSEYQLLDRYRETIRTLTSKIHIMESKLKDLESMVLNEKQLNISLTRENTKLKAELKRTRELLTWLPPDYSALDV